MKTKLAEPPADPSIKDVRMQLKVELDMYLDSAREADGVVRDRNAHHAISCLRKALKLLPRR